MHESNRARLWPKQIVFAAIACALCLLIFEGAASLTLFGIDLLRAAKAGRAEAVHAQYDPDLGWTNIPNHYIKDMYGPALYFRTNSRGFRSNHEIQDQAPADRYRAVCSGDSMTLGYGVDNDNNWCQLLERTDPRIQAVNMGQSGYGADQAYLWYRRDGTAMQHDVLIFAMIGDDFERMQKPQFIGYGKPMLKIQDGRLQPDNVPVPETSALKHWLALNRATFENLRGVQFLARVTGQSNRLWSAEQGRKTALIATPEKKRILSKILEELKEMNAEKGSALLVVYLPVRTEYVSDRTRYGSLPGPPPGPEWQRYLKEETERLGIPFLNLVDHFQAMPEEQVDSFYIPYGDHPFRSQPGHYTVAGNRFVAEQINTKIRELLPPTVPARSGAQQIRARNAQ